MFTLKGYSVGWYVWQVFQDIFSIGYFNISADEQNGWRAHLLIFSSNKPKMLSLAPFKCESPFIYLLLAQINQKCWAWHHSNVLPHLFIFRHIALTLIEVAICLLLMFSSTKCSWSWSHSYVVAHPNLMLNLGSVVAYPNLIFLAQPTNVEASLHSRCERSGPLECGRPS